MKDNSLLAEGFDFIEESTPFSTIPLEFQDISELDISESESKGSKWKIIGKVKGCMAPIGVYSRNHRLYEDCHWIKVLKNPLLQERLQNRRLFGMPSHMQKKIDDEDFREGRISHIVSVLEVRNDNNGKPFLYGEFDILDTPAGRILKAMYEGGAGIYVSTRAAGKLEPIIGDPINKRVNSDSYWLGGIDCVLEPGFIQAKPAFEAISVEPVQPQIHESQQQPTLAVSSAVPTAITSIPTATVAVAEASQVVELKAQVEKLAKIVEKVVDDVYEEEKETPVAEQIETLLDNPLISEEAYEDIICMLKESNPSLVDSIMENSRHRFNAEHAEKTGFKIDHWRFGGTRPYKVVPKDSSYFAASWDSPRYRTLKQAQKHVLSLYNKPEEPKTPEDKQKADKNEALVEVVLRTAAMDVSEESFELVLDALKKGLEE